MRILSFLAALLLATAAMAQPALDFTKIAPHPRLILRQGDIEAVKEKVATDQPLRLIHCEIEDRTNRWVPMETIKRIVIGKRLLGRCRAVLERVCYCSYMYLLSGDELYARRAEKEMLSASQFTDWNPKHFLDVAEMTAALAIGYDWLYDWLSPASRRTIEDAIIEKGLRPSANKGWWSRSHSNWNQVCNSGMIMGALAVYERIPEEAQRIINEALTSNRNVQTIYAPDGVYPEGFGYWEYGTWYQVMLIESLRTALGTSCDLEKVPGFLESAKFMNFMMTPTGRTFNFSDASDPERMINPLLYWFALETGDMSLVWQDRKRLVEEDWVRGINRQSPLAMLFAARCNTSDIQPIKDKFWVGTGQQPVFLYRSGFESATDCYLGVKGGSASISHAHMDAGTFIYEWNGVRWAVDLGNQDYHSLESKGVRLWGKGQLSGRWSVYRLNNYAHNTLTVNEQLHRYEGSATMLKHHNKRKFCGAEFDLTPILIEMKRATRTIGIDAAGNVTCTDMLENHNIECRVRWNMVTFAEAEIIDDRTIALTQEGKRLLVRATAPADVKAYIMENNTNASYDVRNKGVRIGFALTMSPGSKCSLKVELQPQK